MNNTILVADDSPTELTLVLSALGKKGYQIVTATDGEDAIEMARKHQPRLAILDIIMPKKNGFQLTRQLKTEAETMPGPGFDWVRPGKPGLHSEPQLTS